MNVRSFGCALACAMGMATPLRAAVLFENSGTQAGWDSQLTQMKGTITEVASPTFRTATALRMEQTFQGFGGYHSEVRKHDAQKPGEVVFYGEALYLPPEWKFHPQNVTFEQWARSDVFGSPWILMYVEGEKLRLGGSGPAHGDFGSVAGKAGKWIRIVTRIDARAAGTMDLWVDGQKTLSLKGNFVPDGQNLRWSVGMYCTRWRQEQPAGLNPMILFHDQMRVATTYEEADPASWGGGGTAPPPEDAGAPAPVDAGGPAPTPADAGQPPPDASAPVPPPQRPDAARSPPPAGGAGGQGQGDEEPEPTPPVKKKAGGEGGCQVGGGPSPAWGLLVVLGWLVLRRRR
ncbi:MAG TPA: heparin lyase I family protein [Polyangia bacterium]|jgi:MYXO-CTERM domain-containing protein|nr:heparin lyase I family protein [Polyangia bacterium]